VGLEHLNLFSIEVIFHIFIKQRKYKLFMETYQKKYLLPIKLLPWFFWALIFLAGYFLFLNAWRY